MFTSSFSKVSVPAKNFVVASGYFPPIVGGTSTVIKNLLAAFDPARFAVISQTPESLDGTHRSEVPEGVQVTRLGVPRSALKIPYGFRIARWLRFAMVPLIEKAILKEVRRLGAGHIMAVYPSWPFVIAAYRASEKAGVPLSIYYMDVTPEASQLALPDRFVVRHYEKPILRKAAQRLVLSEALQKDFQERFGLGSTVIPHSIDLSATAMPPRPEKPGSYRRIVHTGVIEHLQEEGLKRIATVLEKHPEWNAKLVLSTPTSKADLLSRGFDCPFIEILSLSNAEVRSLQCSADLLVAVLPFHGEIEAYQRTAFPTKSVEYMASGVPILAHAPAGSFFANHVRKHGYALLADSCQEQALEEALHRALEDSHLRDTLLEKARQTVLNEFSIDSVAARFAAATGLCA
jgi:glycosyltransferase involved in cell wall biosynthesis